MSAVVPDTENVVRHHLRAFLEQQGLAAILSDYDDDARFFTEATIYRGKQQIRGFFDAFLASLPERAIDRFALTSLRVDRDVACITWRIEGDVALGTDTFVVDEGKIVSQTFAMYAGAPSEPSADVAVTGAAADRGESLY